MNGKLEIKNLFFIEALFLTLLSIFFIVVKAPYWANNFSGTHSMKYSTYVEPAIHMAENNDFTLYEKGYMYNFNNHGVFQEFGTTPILEWVLASGFSLFPSIPIEVITRSVMTFWGIGFLISFFFLVKTFTSNKLLLYLSTALVASTPLVNFVYYITVYDGIMTIFGFFSLAFVYKSFKENNLDLFWIAAIIAGLGNSFKYNMMIWLIPAVLVLCIYKHRRKETVIESIGIFSFLLALYTILPKLTLSKLPQGLSFNELLIFLGALLATAASAILLKKGYLSTMLGTIKSKFIWITTSLIALLVGFAGYYYVSTQSAYSEFISDPLLIFNINLYYSLLNSYKDYLTTPMFFLAFGGIVLLLINFKKNNDLLLKSLVVGSLVYTILTSKVMFFHNYYFFIVVITGVLLATYFIVEIYKKLKTGNNKFLAVTFLIVIVLMSFNILLGGIKNYVNTSSSRFEQLKTYFEMNTREGDIYIDDAWTTSIVLYSDIKRIGSVAILENAYGLKEDIRLRGFKNALESRGIKFLVTYNKKEPPYIEFASLFTDEKLQSTSANRTKLILNRLNGIPYYEDLARREELVKEYNIKDKFEKVEEGISEYDIYIFKN
jgi:4-amino-4-deoxy-L-arabinose transferase-like glycosyltransferase